MDRDLVDEMLDQWARERPELDASPLSVALRVQMVGRRFRQEVVRSLAPLDLELWEYEVLSALRRQGGCRGLAVSRLAGATQLSRAAMTHRINRLEGRGLVRRRRRSDDRRSVLVALTDQGRRLVDQALEVRFHTARSGMAGLSEGEKHALAGLMRKLMLTTRDIPAA